ncbi:MAG: hypothetical protein LC122_11845 [Chitinophagales bacterium]|nr:hypothetical protein [Chitinophagales bacterium]
MVNLKNEFVQSFSSVLVRKSAEVARDIISGRRPEPHSFEKGKTLIGATVTAVGVAVGEKGPDLNFVQGLAKSGRVFGMALVSDAVVNYTVDTVVPALIDKVVKPSMTGVKVRVLSK